MLLGACYIPDFPVWALRFLEPSLRSRELIVVSGGRVVARSQGPRRLGVEVGWPAERARALAPQALVRVDPGPALELAAEELLAELNRLTPWIEPVSAGQVVLGLDRPAEARPLARRLGLQIGLAEDRDTALLAALQAAPGQVLALAEEQGQAFRQGFPLARLVEIGISPRTVERLEWLGFPTVGSLARLSEAQLTRQFPEGARLHRMVRGADRRPVALYSPPPALTLAVDLDPPQLEPGLAEAALVHLLDQAIERLEGRVAGTLTVGLQAGEQATASRRVLHAPAGRRAGLWVPARLALYAAWNNLPRAVEKERLSLSLGRLCRPPARPLTLWPARPGARALISAMNRRFPGALRKVTCLNPHAYLPEEACVLESWREEEGP